MVRAASEVPSAARLVLCERSDVRGAVNGAWWPKTSDLAAELPDVIAVVGMSIGPVERVVYDPHMWTNAPSRVIRGNAAVKVDPYPLVGRDSIYLVGSRSRDALFFVVSPCASEAAAHRLLSVVSETMLPVSVTGLRRLIADVGESV